MALLDALTYVIEADASKLDRDIDQSRQTTKRLEDGIKDVERQSKSANLSLKDMFKAGIGFLGAFLSVTRAVSSSTVRAEFVGDLIRVSEATNTAIGDVDAFGKSLEALGGDATAANATLQSFAKNVGNALNNVNSEQAKMFASLGVNLKDTQGNIRFTVDIIGDLSASLEGMSGSQATAYLNKLGINDRTAIELILKGREELERMIRSQKESGVVTKEAAESAKKYNEALYRLRSGLGTIGNTFLDKLIPILAKVIDWFAKGVDWVSKHEHIITGVLIAIAAVVSAVYVPAMASAAAATIAATWPILLIAAAVAALAVIFALVYDDIMNFIEGNDSLIGQIIEEYPIVGDVIKALGEVFKFVFGLIKKTLSDSLEIGKQFVEGLINAFEILAEAVKQIFGFIADTISSVVDGVTGAWNSVKSLGNSAVDTVSSTFGFGDEASKNVSIGKSYMAAASANPLNPLTSNAISNTSNTRREQNIAIGEITVQTQATDAGGVAGGINSELLSQLQSLQTESATGVVS